MPPLILGIAIAKTVAFAIGIVAFLCLPFFVSDLDQTKKWVLLLWYPTIAGVAGASNVADMVPMKILRPPWWLRTPLIGAWLNLVVVLFASGTMQDFSMVVHLSFGHLGSQFWFVLDGAILGFLGGYISLRVWQKRAQNQD